MRILSRVGKPAPTRRAASVHGLQPQRQSAVPRRVQAAKMLQRMGGLRRAHGGRSGFAVWLSMADLASANLVRKSSASARSALHGHQVRQGDACWRTSQRPLPEPCGRIALALSSAAWAGPTLLLDASDGRMLYAEDHDNQWHPASLTKIMTAYVAFEALQGRQAQARHQDRLLGARLQPAAEQGRPAGRRGDDRRDGAAGADRQVGQRRGRDAGGRRWPARRRRSWRA